MVPVLYVFASFLGALAAALLVTALLAASIEEFHLVLDFLLIATLLIFLSGGLMLSLRGRARRLRPAQRFWLALLLWVMLPVFAALPLLFALDNVHPVDAYFEAVSALTTTGARVLGAPEHLPRTIVFWLSLTQWLGGALTLLVIVLVLAPSGVGGLPETHQRLVEHGGLLEWQRLVMFLREIGPLYVAATALCFLLLALSGLDPLDAVCLAFASISTGGFAPRSAEIGAYVPSFGIFVLAVFMIYGATSILWHRDILIGRWRLVRIHRESLWVVLLCLIVGGIAMLALLRAGQPSALALRDGLFTAVSLVTTTGLEVHHASFEVLPITLVFGIVAMGAAAFSTAGGIKLFRIGAMFVQAQREMTRLVYPHSIRPARFGSQSYDIQIMKAIWSGFLAFVAGAAVLSWIVAAEGVAYEGAVLAAFSILSNAGPVYASDWAIGQEWLTYAQMSIPTKLALSIGMILGRLEIIAVLAIVIFTSRRS